MRDQLEEDLNADFNDAQTPPDDYLEEDPEMESKIYIQSIEPTPSRTD